MFYLMVFVLMFPTMLGAEPLSVPPGNGEIPRFVEIAAGLYRGGQPTETGLRLLKERGIKTVINLRMENDESNLVQRLGMNYVHIPIEDIRPWSQIPEAAIAKYFELVNNPANYPIFFHCRRGADRTGAMAALYRMAVQGWDARRAYSEALDIGMRPWYLGLKAQLYDFRPPERAKLQPAIEGK
jgi:protein tyrosine/serine phosphatase